MTTDFTGDVILHPIQLQDPGILSNFDTDQGHAKTTRQKFIDDHSKPDVLVLGTHFTTPCAGRIVRNRNADGWSFSGAEEP